MPALLRLVTSAPVASFARRWIGRNRKIVTVVRFGDEYEVSFCDRIPKGSAIRQATALLAREPERYAIAKLAPVLSIVGA